MSTPHNEIPTAGPDLEHLLAQDVHHFAAQAGLQVEIRPNRLPRGQVLCEATRI